MATICGDHVRIGRHLLWWTQEALSERAERHLPKEPGVNSEVRRRRLTTAIKRLEDYQRTSRKYMDTIQKVLEDSGVIFPSGDGCIGAEIKGDKHQKCKEEYKALERKRQQERKKQQSREQKTKKRPAGKSSSKGM